MRRRKTGFNFRAARSRPRPMNARPARPPGDRARAAQSDRRRRRRQRRQGAPARAPGGRATAPTSSCFPELFIAGYPPEDLVLKPAFQAACRAAVEALARETADGGPALLVGTPWVEDGKLYNAYALLDGGAIAGRALQGRSAELRRVRREARVRAGADAGAGQLPRRAHRRADLRGHLGRRGGRVPGRDRRARSCSCRTARPIGAARPTCGSTSRWRASPRAACRWSIVNQVGGQDELVFDGASFVLQRRSLARRAAAGVPREASTLTQWRRSGDGWRCVDGPIAHGSRRATRPTTPPACWACATTSTRTASRAWCSASPAASIPRCARRWRSMRSGAERVRCVMLPYRFTSQESLDDAAACRQGARRALRHRADRERGARASSRRWRRCSTGRRATSPRRTCRRARAARS